MTTPKRPGRGRGITLSPAQAQRLASGQIESKRGEYELPGVTRIAQRKVREAIEALEDERRLREQTDWWGIDRKP